MSATAGFVVCLLAAAAITGWCRKPAGQTWTEFLGMTEEGR